MIEDCLVLELSYAGSCRTHVAHGRYMKENPKQEKIYFKAHNLESDQLAKVVKIGKGSRR